MSYILMTLINLIPGCKFRVDEEGEIIGVDDVEMGEWSYDFIQLRREVDSTHGFLPADPEHGHAPPHPFAGGSRVKPASINSSEDRIRKEAEIRGNGGQELHFSGVGAGARAGATDGGAGGPSDEPPANSREKSMAAGINGGADEHHHHKKEQ